MEYCPNCGSVIAFDANICVKCGWRPYHGIKQGTINYYPLIQQDFKNAGIVSILSSCLIIALCSCPIWFHNKSISEDTAISILFVNVFLIVFSIIWLTIQLYKYLHNFYHPLDNIFYNIKWKIASVILLCLFFTSRLIINISHTFESVLLLLSIGLYVLWVFMQILVGWSLIKTDQYDYVGGLSALGYGILASGIVPPLIVFTPFLFGNLFLKAHIYSKRINCKK